MNVKDYWEEHFGHARLGAGEAEAIEQALAAGRAHGYGNIMAWLATEWAMQLRDKSGLDEKIAIEFVSNRSPYRLPHVNGKPKSTQPKKAKSK